MSEPDVRGQDIPTPHLDGVGRPLPGMEQHQELLTKREKRLVDELGGWFIELCGLINENGDLESVMSADKQEAATHVHALQNMILAQAAARAYPRRYRLIGRRVH